MKQPKLLTALLLLLITTNQLFADTIPDGSLIYGTWLTNNSPYVIMGEVEVPYDSTLIIEAGVTVKMKSSTKDSAFYYPTLDVAILKVFGRIVAEGNETDSIIFEKTGDGWWGSISFLGYTDEPNIIKYCQVSYGNHIGTAPGGTGFTGGMAFNGAHAIIEHSLFHHNPTGISWGNSDIVIENCIIRNNRLGISCGYSSSLINNNWIYNNQEIGISTHSTHSIITNNIIENSLTGINCYESNDTISHNIIRNNLWGGIHITRNNSIINNNIIYGSNSGIRCSGKPLINNNTIVNNNYFGIYCDYNANPIIINSILYGNQNLITYSQEDTVVFANCLVQVDTLPEGIINGGGNIYNMDPYFENISNEEFSLSINSPCIDAGTTIFIWENDTILNLSQDDYFGNAPDIGAIESAFVAINDNHKSFNNITIMPNPASNIINIYSPTKIKIIIISNLSGKFIQLNSVSSNKIKVDISNLPNGLYFAYILLDNGLTTTKKIVINN